MNKKLLPYSLAIFSLACASPQFPNRTEDFQSGSLEEFAQTQNPRQVIIIHSNEKEPEDTTRKLTAAGIQSTTLNLRDEDPLAEYAFSIKPPKYDTIFFMGTINESAKRMLYNLSQAYFVEKKGNSRLKIYNLHKGNLEKLTLEKDKSF